MYTMLEVISNRDKHKCFTKFGCAVVPLWTDVWKPHQMQNVENFGSYSVGRGNHNAPKILGWSFSLSAIDWGHRKIINSSYRCENLAISYGVIVSMAFGTWNFIFQCFLLKNKRAAKDFFLKITGQIEQLQQKIHPTEISNYSIW